ncbi:MAG TPA: hypothetical protein VGO07_03260 [Candidatus Saccharimonadales bacterium]|nr:hypothetical protein [Candidatus Saccharimonadales bacterium]
MKKLSLRIRLLHDAERTVMLSVAAIITVLLVASSVLATVQPRIEAEAGTLTDGAVVADNADASGSKMVVFNSPVAGAPAASGAKKTTPGTGPAPSGSTGGTSGGTSGGSSGGGTSAPSGWPDDNNTGYPHGVAGDTRTPVTLTAYAGPCILTSPTTINGKDISCRIEVRSSGVVIKNSRIRVVNENAVYVNNVYHVVIMDTELDGQHGDNSAGGISLIGDGSYTCIRCNMHGSGDIARINWGGIAIIDSWLHDPYCIQNSCHNDVMQSTDGNCTNGVDGVIGKVAGTTDTDTGNYCIKIVHNRLENPNTQTSNILLKADQGPIHNVLEDNNLFNGGGYTLYWYDSTYQISQGIIRNNRFKRSPTGGYWPNGGYYGPSAGNVADQSRWPTWTNNVWDDTGAAIPF